MSTNISIIYIYASCKLLIRIASFHYFLQFFLFYSLKIDFDCKDAFKKPENRKQIRILQEKIKNNDITAVKEALNDHFNFDLRYRGQTAFQLAVRLGLCKICTLLIVRGANINTTDETLNSPLHIACINEHDDIARLLLAHNALVDIQNDAGFTPLHTSAYNGNSMIASALIDAGCLLNVPDQNGCTAVMVAAMYGNAAVLLMLCESKASVNWVDQYGKTPMIAAAECSFGDIVETLIISGWFSCCYDLSVY